MAQDNIHKMYERLSTRFDLGTEEQFRDYVTASTDNSKKMYERMSTRFELGSEQEWLDFMGGAKQQRETAAAKGDAEGASTFSEAEIIAETVAAEPQPANDLPIPQTQGKSTSSTPTPGAWPYAGAHRMQDGYVVSNAPGRDTGWRLTNEDGTPRTWEQNVEATKTDEQRTREQFGEHRSELVQDLLTDHAKTKAVPSERVVVDSEGNEVERYEVTPELSQEEAEYQARDDYYKKVKLDGERWAELEAARKQVYDEYNKELGKAHKEISELYKYVDAGAPVDIYDWVSNRRDVKALKGALKYYDEALTMVKEARAVNDSPNNFLGELAGLGRGLLDAGLDVSTWDMGMSDLDQGASTLSAILKLEAGKELTSAEQRLLAAAAANTYANSSLGEQMGMGYKAGQTTMMSVPFMIEMALNPASGLGSAGSKALSKHLIKKYGREMIQKQLKKRLARQTMAAKWGAKIGGDAGSAGVMTLTSGAAMTAADAVDRMTGTIKPTEDEEGNIVYGGREDYEKSALTAGFKAVASGAIERHTEMVGGYIPAMKTAGATFLGKAAKKATNPRLRKIYREAEELLSGKAFGKWGEMVGKVADVTKLNDLAGEFFEEKIGEVENALLVGDMTFDTNSQTGIFNLDRNIETLVGLLPMQAFFGGMTALGYRTQKYRTNQALNKANKAAWETFGEDWIEMKDMIDGCETDKDLTKVVRGIISGGTTDLRSQAVVMQYVSAVQRQKGLQLVAETAPEIVAQAEAEDAAAAAMPQPTENTGAADAAAMPQPTENGGATSQTAYDRGVAAAEADDYAAMSDIGYQADLADARIERMFDEAQRAEIAEAENTEGGLETWLESNRESLSAEQAFAVQALIDANDAYDGLTETVRHRTASEEEAIRQEMQPLATADGRIVPLTLDNGQTVYLKSGDPTNRRSTVIAAYRDETGAVRNTQVSGMSITSIGTEQSLSDYTLEAMSNINYERQQRIKDAMDGKNVAAGQTVRLYAGDELQEYEVTAVAPEGATLRSKQDGSEMTMTTEELQDELAMSRQKRIENDLAAAMPQPTENTEGAVAAAAQPQLTEAAKEEERRKPLRARVAQWSQDIGADIEIHEDTSSITSSAVLNQINSGQGRVRGWYDNATGKVHVYMPGITDEHDIDETVIHEIVAHKGLRQLMGSRFDALCDKVYEMMSEDARQKYLAYPGVNGDTRAAADEYMAYLAENMENLTAEEQNVWQAIVAAVREFIKSVMTGSQMTDAQIEQLIRASYLNMKAQREQAIEAAAEPQLTDNTRAAVAAEREQTVEAAAQVAEKENLESQENAEKNVSLQTKEGRMGVVARQKNSAARLAKAKEIYGSDPTTAPFFDDMDVPQTAEELVAMTLVPRSINWEGIDRGTQHIRGLQEEMGRNKKRGIGRNFDTNGFNLYLAKKGEGVGIEKLVEDIWRSDKNGMGEGNMLGDQRRFDEHEIKDALLSLLSGAQTSKDISDYVLNNRIAQAEAAIEYMEEEAAYEQELYEQERREDAKLAGILELTEDDWLQMEAEYADKIAEIEAKEREQREIFQQILEQDHQQAEYYGRANQEEVASERGIRMAEESAERGTAGSAERGETVLRGAQDTRDEGLSVGDAQLSEGALGAQNGRDGRSEDVHTQEAERSDVGETEAVPQFTEELERQKAETNTNPTEAQKEAGNYKKGHLTFGGYKFTIENPKGSVRSGKNKKGKAWKVTMPVTYGYILGKKGKDGDHLDMFINDKADLSTWNGSVFVVDQVNPETGEFDEHKIMYGFNDITDAIRAYLMSYTRPWRGMGNITEVSKEKFDEWVASSDRKLKPFAETRFGDKADVGTKVIRAAEERAGKRQEGETPEQDRDKQIEKAYKRGYNSYRQEQYTDETLLEMYASMSNEAIEADISKMERSIEEEKAYKDSEEYQERRSNESSDYTRAQTEGVAARVGKSVKALETNIAEAKRVLELRSMDEGRYKSAADEGVRFSVANDNQEIFVSNAEQAVKGIKQEKATPQQWKAMIQSKGGLKASEDKWLGLSEWLDEQATAKRSLTKQEVLDFIGENKIRIEEVEYSGANSNDTFTSLKEEYNQWLREEGYDYAWEQLTDRYGDDAEIAFMDLAGELTIGNEEAAAALLGENVINSTRLDYTTEGLENKREIALTVPTIESWDESDDIHFGDAGQGRAVAWARFGETVAYETINDVQEVTEFHEPYENVNRQDVYKPVGSFKSGDYVVHAKGRDGNMIYVVYINDKQLPVAHATLDDARNAMNEYYKENPRKLRKPLSVLVIDEIQSKRHQEGREQGYAPKKTVTKDMLREARAKENQMRTALEEKYGKPFDGELPVSERAEARRQWVANLSEEDRSAWMNQRELVENYLERLDEQSVGIPDAPFDKNWHELAMKRMLRLAAEEGFDKVAWTKGAQQAERYNLGGRVDEIKVTGGYDGIFTVIGRKDGGILVQKDVEGEQGLADMIGKDLARKAYSNLKEGKEDYLNEDGAVSFTGDNLSIGGEGMKGFYDKMLPSFMNKYGKKWGVKVEEVELPEVEEAGRKMWSVDVTPEMKESVMEGQVMFSVKDKNANNLVVMHNISEGDLRKVLETGGLIMPSIAITDVNIGFSGFGDISLLFDKETINPSDRRNKVYGGDAWTPRFPQLVPKLNKEKVKSVADKLYELLSKDLQDYFGLSSEVHSENIEDNIIRGGIASYYSKDFMKIAYLLDNGKKFKVPMKPKPYGRLSEIIIRLAKEMGVSLDDINNASYEFYENNPDFVDAIKLADAEARTQNLSSEVREKVRDMILEKPMHFSSFDRAISAARSMEHDLNNGGLKQVVDGEALYEAINKKVKTDNADYNKWVDDLFDGIVEKYGIRNNKDWYTPSGNRRSWEQLYDAATPSNILRYMIAQNTQGGSGGLFDSSIFGASAEEYKSIEEIRERGKKRLHKEESDDYDEWIESVTSRISDIKNEFLTPSERNDFRSSADANDAIVRAVAKDKTAKGIYSIMKRDYRNFTMEHAKMVADIVKEIQDKSVTYFEAKPQRIVPLSEIRKAIVPSNVDSDIIEGLQKNGIEVATYRRGNENARNRLIKKESNEIRFSFIGEQGASNLDKAEEATTRLDNLSVAREMEEAGKGAKSIKMATGWERGADKKWRYEVDDKMEGLPSPMDKLETLYKEYKTAEKSFDRLMETSNRLPRLPRTATEEQKAKRKEFDKRLKEARETWLAKRETFMEADNRRNFTLEEILGADHELFAAYPQLKTREVSYMDKSDFAGYSGLYMPESGNFWISPTADNPMSVLTHEIQHAIQHIEGFAQGGNTHSSTKKIAEVMNVIGAPNGLPFNNLVSYLENGMETSQQHKQLLAMAEANGYDDIVDYVESLNPYGYYHRLSGEVEARNAAERMGMTAAERRASLAEETEDVAREDQVFIFEGLESAAMPQSTKLSASVAMSWKEGSEKPNSEVSADELRFRESSIEEFGESLGGTKVQFADSERFADDADAMERIERGDKGWYDTATGEVVIITENCADEADMARALLHEKLGHEGLAALLGGEKGVMKWGEYIWKSASESLRKRIAQRADKEGYPLSDRNRWSKAAQEVFADMASEGTMSNDEYSLWTKARHYVYRALKALNIRIPGSMTDADLRYYVKKTAEALKKTAAEPQTTENREHYEGSRMAARGDGRPRKKRNESQAQYNQRLLEWERRQVANENDPAPEMPELSAEEIRQEYNEYQRGWMARHGLPEDYEPGVTVGDENAQIFDREKHDSNDPYIEMLGYIPEAMRRWREEYHAWEQRNALGEAENVDLLLYNGESSNRPDDATSMEAEARLGNTLRERTIFDEISEAVGFDNTPEGAKRHAKNAVINRRKELESASAEDAIFIQGLGKKIDGIAKRLNVKSKDVRSALITLIELPIMRKNKEQAEQEALETINTSEAMNNAHTKLTLDNLRELREQIGNMLSKHVRHKEDQNNQEKWYELYEAAKTLSDALNQMNAGNEGYVALYADDVIAAYKQFEAAYAATAELPSSELLDKLENDETTKELLGEIKDWYDLMYHYIENAGLRGDAGYIAEGYVNHIWDKSKSDPEAYDRYVRLKSANMRHREIPTYADGIAVGLVPKFTDILDIMSYYSRQNIEAVSNRHLLDNLLNLCVDVKNTDGEVVQQLPVVTTASPSFGDRSRYERYEIPGISGDVWVLKDVKGWFNAIFGTERTPGIGPKMRSAAKAYDVLSGILKTIQLSFSFFHAGALTEVSVAQQGPIKGFKDILKYIIVESAFKGTMPAYAHPADFKLAASHLVQLGATKDYAAAEVAGFYDKIHEVMQDFRKEHPNPLTWTGELAAALPKYLNKGMSIMLWEYLHDGLKIALFKKLAGDVDKRLLHIYNTGQQDTNQYEDFATWQESKAYRILREQMLDEAGQYVNDTFGGQYWELMNVSPTLIKWLRRALLSPDWLISTQRHFFSMFGFGSLYSEGNFREWIKYNTDNLQRLLGKDVPRNELRRMRSKNAKECYLIGVAIFYYAAFNIINAIARAGDEDDEKKKAEEIRKTNPDYKSPYELAYPDGMKWWEYTMLGNSPRHETHLFLGRYEDGTEYYVRWGKQFREFPELFIGKNGFEFPGPLIERMKGKSNPLLRYTEGAFGVLDIHGYNAPYDMQEMRDKYGKEITLLAYTAQQFLPFSVPTQEDKEFKLLDLAMPSQKGFTRWKAVNYFEDFIVSGEMDGIERTYKAAVMNGINAEECLQAAIARVKATQRKEMGDGITDLQGAYERFDASKDLAERKLMRQKMRKYLSQSGWKNFSKADAVEKAQEFINGGSKEYEANNGANDSYLMAATAADIAEDWRIDSLYQLTTPIAKELKDMENAGVSAQEVNAYAKNHEKMLEARKMIGYHRRVVNILKRDIALHKDSAMTNIREKRKELLETLGENKPENK